nr:pirin-like C-terminal cupin domain-containing protein [Microbacterium sp. NIBRBAC000506063]
MDALQLWTVLPEDARHGPGGFEQHHDLPTLTIPAEEGADAEVTVVLGEYRGTRSPASAFTPIVGAEIVLAPGSRVELPLAVAWEHAIMLVEGDVRVAAVEVPRGQMQFLGDGRDVVEVISKDGALLFLLGGEPFEEDLVMWWNFAGRTHEEIAQAREDWEAGSDRFGHVIHHGDERIPAPPIPPVRLMPRRRHV